MRNLLPLLALSLAVGCGGGSGTSAVAPSVPVVTPPLTPPVIVPPVIPPALIANHIAAAPAQVFTTTGIQSLSRRSAQSVNLGNNGIPSVVGATSPYFGTILTQIFAWAENAQNSPVQEASMTAVPANVVSGPVSVASIGQDNGNLFAQTFFDWVTQLQINKVGSGGVVIRFADGSTGTIPVFIYDQWYLTCVNAAGITQPPQWAYKSGVPTGLVNPPDMSVDCAAHTITFTNGAIQTLPPVADAWGNVASAFINVTNGTTNASTLTVPVANIVPGTIYIAKLAHGGYAKIMPLVNDGVPAAPNVSGISLHDSPSGSGQFSF